MPITSKFHKEQLTFLFYNEKKEALHIREASFL